MNSGADSGDGPIGIADAGAAMMAMRTAMTILFTSASISPPWGLFCSGAKIGINPPATRCGPTSSEAAFGPLTRLR